MKKILLMLVALFATTALVKAADEVVFPTDNPYGWQNKGDMFQAFMQDSEATEGYQSLDYYLEILANEGDPLKGENICKYLMNPEKAFANDGKWGWLKAYIMEVQNAQVSDKIKELTDEGSGTYWRYAVGAFFVSWQLPSWPYSADFSEAGKEENYVPAFIASYAPRTLSLVGAFNNWNVEEAPEFVKQEDGTYVVQVDVLKAGGFKIVEGHTWGDPQYASSGAPVVIGEEYQLQADGGNLVIGNGILNYNDCKLTLREDGDNLLLTLEATPGTCTVTSWSLVGEWNGWGIGDSNAEMTKVSETQYTIEFNEFSGQFGIFETGNWNTGFKSKDNVGVIIGEEYILGQDGNILIEDGKKIYNCKITFNIYSDKCTILVEGELDANDQYYLTGFFNGWDPSATAFTAVGEGVYELMLDSFSGEFKITKNGTWAGSLSTNGAPVVVGETYYPSTTDGSNMSIEGVTDDDPLTNCKFTLNVAEPGNPTLLVTGTTGAEKVAKDGVKVMVSTGVISVAGAEGVAIYNAAGALISTSAKANVPAGLYIVKAGKTVQKVVVR